MGVTFTVQWFRASTPIPAATAATYVCTTADVGFPISCAVTAHNGAATATALSPPTLPVTAAAGTYASTFGVTY